ncbi:hypothetical protein [Comamonas aquatica]|uniref:hypothetical protein n=1 Tax=Comamonas aquatica TaxID=225991 RepID=UPI0028D883E7|nr:hypothetical protein [Comamonas aquatica]
MNAIVMNTLNGAVTEYSRFAFQSITPRLAGSALGLFQLGGDTDAGEPIAGRIDTGARDWGSIQLKQIAAAYFSLRQTSGQAVFAVGVEDGSVYSYPVALRAKGVSRADPGRGIRENFLSFGFEVPGGQAFVLSGIEVDIRASKTRRVA